MAIALKFEKPDNQTQWGFRLVGGADFETPLVVVKVHEKSLAEQLGLEEGDIIVRINNTPTAGLTHIEAHELLLRAGNEFELGIRRGDILYYQQWVNDIQNNVEVSEILKSTLQAEGNHQQLMQLINEGQNTDTKLIETVRTNIEEESSVSENLSGQEKIIDPMKLIKEGKKWSTFLQKPDNPIVISKKEKDEKKSQGAPYRVVIKKQKRRGGPRRVQFEEADVEIKEIESTTVEETTEKHHIEETEKEGTEIQASEIEVELKVTEKEEIDVYIEEGDNAVDDNVECHYEVEEVEETITKVKSETVCESSLSLEEQLIQVQRQLQALSAIPSEIQVTLDAVTQQLAQIVGVNTKSEEEQRNDENNEENGENNEENGENNEENGENNKKNEEEESIPDNDQAEGDITDEEDNKQNENNETEIKQSETENEKESTQAVEEVVSEEPEDTMTEEEKEAIRIEQEKEAKKQKDMDMRPIQRPIILPGGRKWTDADDACPKVRNPKMTDEKIASTIETYSEVIVGKAKGINFLKYTPPPKNLDYLQRSEVYKLIHDQEPPVRGISTRMEKIMSEQDYLPHGEP
ncbi:unnamed protein product [Brassicogethes aeneus]|uniref:PDZ domain-containing protein n=1 Tax=Brassicogethes aeneus TaxID=1431903 RepID=A0A9P0B7I5_BRAAE|nr:unnamed protein product [Brassicogethes aeneus]